MVSQCIKPHVLTVLIATGKGFSLAKGELKGDCIASGWHVAGDENGK